MIATHIPTKFIFFRSKILNPKNLSKINENNILKLKLTHFEMAPTLQTIKILSIRRQNESKKNKKTT